MTGQTVNSTPNKENLMLSEKELQETLNQIETKMEEIDFEVKMLDCNEDDELDFEE